MRLKIRSSVAAWVGALWALSSGFGLSPAGAAKKYHPASSHKAHHAAQAKAKAAHLARLAIKEKAAWRAHLAKVRELPRRKRLAVKRHDRKVAKLKTIHLAQAQKAQRLYAAHLARLAVLARHHRRKLAQKPSAHSKHLAQQTTHDRKLAALRAAREAKSTVHNARLAQAQAAHLARLRARQQALAQKALSHRARLAKLQAIHNARLATKRSHWVALHGDGSGGRSIKFWQTVAAGVPVKCITVDLNDSNVKVSAVMARRGTGTAEPFRQMILRAQPNVAVTGTFFSLDNLRPVGDIVIDGSLIHFGGMGTALCITPDNQAQMVTCEWGRHHDWSPYDFVVACGPRLLRHGRVVLDPRAERFRDRHMLAPNSRIAVGITRGNKVVFVMTHKPIYLGRLAKVMRSVGASEAMNLDAGTSTGFYYNGATLAHPGRNLTNMIVVYGRKARYERALPELVPATYRRMDTHYPRRRISMLPR